MLCTAIVLKMTIGGWSVIYSKYIINGFSMVAWSYTKMGQKMTHYFELRVSRECIELLPHNSHSGCELYAVDTYIFY